MPDQANSTPFMPVRAAQDEIALIAVELAALEERLAQIAIDFVDDSAVAEHLRAGIPCVRTDLLADAIETLMALSSLTEEAAGERSDQLIAAVKSATVFC